jgi:hypothetical protein
MKTKRYRTAEKPAKVKRSPKRAPTRSYEGKLDEKKRLVIRGARHKYYHVQEEPNGMIVLTPQKLVEVEPISERAMKMMESSIKNLKKGITYGPIDLSEYRKRFGVSNSK